MATITLQEALVFRTVSCYSCGITFAMQREYFNDRISDKKNWYCPNGHSQQFVGESDATKAERLAKELENAKRNQDYYRARNTHLQDQLQATKRQATALKGALTKAKKKAGAGVCPADGCHRHFANLQRHVQTKHPDLLTDA